MGGPIDERECAQRREFPKLTIWSCLLIIISSEEFNGLNSRYGIRATEMMPVRYHMIYGAGSGGLRCAP